MMSNSRVVVFRPGALGDTIVAADALAAIRGSFPSQCTELVGNASAAALLQASGLVDVVTSFDSLDVAGLFGRTPTVAARWRDAELVVLWLKDAEKIAQAFRNAGTRRVVAANPRPAPSSGARPHPPSAPTWRVARDAAPTRVASPGGRGETVHISDYLLETLRSAGAVPVSTAPTLLRPPTWSGQKSTSGHNALLHPGSGSPSKNWPPDRFAALATRLLEQGWIVRLLRGPADADAIANVRALASESRIAVEEPADVAALANILTSADLYVGNDSGVSHVSARLGVPTVAVFGPTDPNEWAPRGPRVSVVDGAGAWPSLERVWDALHPLIAQTVGARKQESGATGLDARASPGRTRRQRE